MRRKLSLGFAIVLGTQVAIAEESLWSGEGELGITHTSGNTTNENTIAKLKIGYARSSWEHEAKLEVLRTSDDDELTAERYGLDFESNYKLSDKDYLFGKLRYEDDSFSGYKYQASLTGGYGYKIFETDITSLKLKAGIGVRLSELETTSESDASEADDQEGIVILGLNYSRKIGTHSEFTQDFLVEAGSENLYTESDTGLKVSIMDNLALKLSLSIKNNSDAPADKEKTDTVSAVTLVYSF
jgi:putative salt-induced outer membrane protein